MNYQETSDRLEEYRRQIAQLRKQMRAAQAAAEPEEVADYAFTRADGATTRLSDLFGDKDTLFVIHNMGAGCAYCTLWADGFNGVYEHLRNRAGFAVSSPDAPSQQQAFAASRGWKFPMISYQAPGSARTWATASTAARSRASRCFGARPERSCASPTPASSRAMISAACGTCST